MNDTLSPQNADNFRWLTNLMIADRIARVYGASRPAAIRRCARRMRDQTISEAAYEIAKLLINKPDNYLVPFVERRVKDFEEKGMLYRTLPSLPKLTGEVPTSRRGMKQWVGGAR